LRSIFSRPRRVVLTRRRSSSAFPVDRLAPSVGGGPKETFISAEEVEAFFASASSASSTSPLTRTDVIASNKASIFVTNAPSTMSSGSSIAAPKSAS
jgi:hypothetical protein